jgi:ubiquinone/menaquinone biosynthesis C-methylase UbiE
VPTRAPTQPASDARPRAASATTATIIAGLGQERYAIRGGREGFERLKLLHRARWPDTAALFDRIGVGPGKRCADLGCGGGEVTFEIARLVGPDGHVTGFDKDDVQLDLARAAAVEQGLANLDFRSVDVNDWSEPGVYDVVYCRLLLEHLSRPIDLLERMWAAVRPGGVLAVEDADFDGLFCDPPNDGFEFFATTLPTVIRTNGGDPTTGRKLHRHFREAGILAPELELMLQQVRSTSDEKALVLATLDATSETLVAGGIATPEEIAAARASLAAFVADEETMLAGPRIFQCWSRRPAA